MKDLDFFYFLNILRKNWIFCLCGALVLGTLTFCLNRFIIHPTYQADVSLYCGRIVDESTDDKPRLPQEYVSYLNIGLSLVNDYRELLNSNRIKDRVKSELYWKFLHKEYMPSKENDKLLPKYEVKVELARQTRLLKISVQSKNPTIACLAAQIYGNVFIDEVQKIMHLQNSQIIDEAKMPEKPVAPHIIRNTIIGLGLGFMLVYGVYFLLSLLDTTIKNPDEAVSMFSLPIIGTIPESHEILTPNYNGSFIVTAESQNAADSVAENFRAARVNIQYDDIGTADLGKVIIVTSSIPAEGKSFCSSNLAAAMAETGKKVLLINCDLRKPTLQKIFHLTKNIGLVNILVGEKTFDEAVTRNLMDRPLDVLFCGPLPPNPTKLLLSGKFTELLNNARKEYDYIFLDTPPVLATADANVLGVNADGVLLIVRCNYTYQKLVNQTISNLKQAKLNLIGMMLNRHQIAEAGRCYGYGRGYGYGYGYGYGKKEHHHKKDLREKIRMLFHNDNKS